MGRFLQLEQNLDRFDRGRAGGVSQRQAVAAAMRALRWVTYNVETFSSWCWVNG